MKPTRIWILLIAAAFVCSTQLPAFSAEPKAKGDFKKGEDQCVEAASGPIVNQASKESAKLESTEGPCPVLARVGGKAPDFEAQAYFDGGFKNIKLSDYRGKWVVLCFYPGDFTFV